MNPLRCACLVDVRERRLLLVRVRQNAHWYLPGGKIEPGETPDQTLQRELAEELAIQLDPPPVRYLYTVRGPAYGRDGEVELVCFSASRDGPLRPGGEISDVQWLDIAQTAPFRPRDPHSLRRAPLGRRKLSSVGAQKVAENFDWIFGGEPAPSPSPARVAQW